MDLTCYSLLSFFFSLSSVQQSAEALFVAALRIVGLHAHKSLG